MKTSQSDTAKTTRRHLSAQDKVKILRLHLLEGKPISEICEEHAIAPSLFYTWQRTFFENGAATFEGTPRSRRLDDGGLRIAQLESKLKRKDEVISMVTEEPSGAR